MKYLLKLIVGLAIILMTVATTWFYAWICKPDITSETVWFIGLVLGSAIDSLKYHRYSEEIDREFG